MEILRFNRHECMSAETRSEILDIIGDLEITDCNSRVVVNYLYGLFDGYDYSEELVTDPLNEELTAGGNGHLVERISAIALLIENYPKYSTL